MKHERLTIRNSDGSVSQPTNSTIEKVFNRLAEFEDKIEQGLMIELPHMTYLSCGLWEILYLKNGELFHYRCSYKKEAEAKLKELQE